MSESESQSDDYRAGFLAGQADRQLAIEWLEREADRLYRVAYDDERRPPAVAVTRAELEQRRALSEPPAEVTRASALESWGIDPEPADTAPAPNTATAAAVAAPTEISSMSTRPANRSSRRRQMSTRTITGNLAVDPEAVQAGRVQIVKLRVIENTGEYRAGEWTEHPAATTHVVEAKFELGEHVLASLRKGDGVIVIGYEHTVSWGEGEKKRYGRVIDADAIGPNLARATAVVTAATSRTTRRADTRSAAAEGTE